MKNLPNNAVEGLSFLLQEWMATAFTTENLDVPHINSMWIILAEALCGSHSLKIEQFQSEIASLRSTTKAGFPPINSLEQRLYELIDAGVKEFFLVIAVRQALDQLIELYFPLKLENWLDKAEKVLPLKIQFAYTHEN